FTVEDKSRCEVLISRRRKTVARGFTRDGLFRATLPLNPGVNKFDVIAVDSAGNKSLRQRIVLTSDLTAPKVHFEAHKVITYKKWLTVRGRVDEQCKVVFGDQTQPLEKGPFQIRVPGKLGQNETRLTFRDSLGHNTVCKIQFERRPVYAVGQLANTEHCAAIFESLDDAFKSAENGSRIIVSPGQYSTNLKTSKSFELIGLVSRKVQLICQKDTLLTLVDCKNFLIKNIDFLHLTAASNPVKSHAIFARRTSLSLENCQIRSKYNIGLQLNSWENSAEKATLRNCVFYDSGREGVFAVLYSHISIENCKFTNTGGVSIFQGKTATVTNCTFDRNGRKTPSLWVGGTYTTIHSSVFKRSKEIGIIFEDRSTGLFEKCQIFQSGQTGLVCKSRSTIRARHCRISNNGSGNKGHGVAAEGGSTVTLENCQVNTNGRRGLVSRDSTIIAKKCDLTKNKRGPHSKNPRGTIRIR
ncbi:MAG: right-handed parallel beta-helix repeat-containing protein, partial [Planctomycetota bacterium]|nr:right-handed parallel beta-helix repeat-containing protein [Planctomycetota bacterium]